jgi:ABC-type protease/lipase transport system fused ATPase/permease subunit
MLIIEKSFSFLLWLSNILLSLVFISAWFSIGYEAHLVSASVATLLSLFVQVSTLFYFIGSGRWIKDQAEEILPHDKAKAFRIWDIYQKANKLKAGPMPFATFGILLGLFTFILGGALQVGAVSAWVHITLASLFLINNWTGHIFTLRAMKRNLEYLDLTSKEIDSQLRTQQ